MPKLYAVTWDADAGINTEVFANEAERDAAIKSALREWLGADHGLALDDSDSLDSDAWQAATDKCSDNLECYIVETLDVPSPDLSPLYRKDRAEVFKGLLAWIYGESDDHAANVRDMLTDLRHVCDASGLAFHAEDGVAYSTYRDEIALTR